MPMRRRLAVRASEKFLAFLKEEARRQAREEGDGVRVPLWRVLNALQREIEQGRASKAEAAAHSRGARDAEGGDAETRKAAGRGGGRALGG